jgi:hypothetical protein
VRGLQVEGYEHDPEYLKRLELEVLRIAGMLIDIAIREIMRSAKWVMEFTDNPWEARFTVVYHDGFEDYVYDNEAKKMFRAPLERIVPILLRYGDVGIIDYPQKGFRMIVKRDRVIDDIKGRFVERLKWVVEMGLKQTVNGWFEELEELYS